MEETKPICSSYRSADRFSDKFRFRARSDISPKAASVQVERISKLTKIPKETLEQLIKDQTEGAALGLFGETRVNVLKLNLELQKIMK